LLLENGANRDSATQAGKTPLMIAAWQGHEAVALLLIDKGANVQTAIDRDGQTALMHAAHGGNLAIVNAMLQKGAIVNQKSTAGASALAIALGVPAPNPAVLARLRNAVETEAPSLDF
jgi:ankyrin repeat protein